MASPLGGLLVLDFQKEDYLKKLMCVIFITQCGKWEGWNPLNRCNYTSWMAIVTPTGRPK